MAQIRGFRASRFSAEAGPLSRLVAPPSETISPEARERLVAEPNNIVHATMPPSDPDDRSKFVRYARASAQLSVWRRGGVLTTDAAPAIYRLRGREAGADLFALVPLASIRDTPAPVSVKAREERLRTIEATRTQLEPIDLLVLGASDDLARPLGEAPIERFFDEIPGLWETEGQPLASYTDTEGRACTLEAIADPAAVARFAERTAGLTYVAAGDPSMVEAARAFRAALGERPAPIAEDFVLARILGEGVVPSGLLLWSLGDFA